MDFLIPRPLPPNTGYHFWGGGGWRGSKVCVQKNLNEGRLQQNFQARSVQPGIKPPTRLLAVGCIAIRPLTDVTDLVCKGLPLLVAQSVTEKTQTLCCCLPDCLADCQPLFEVHCRRQ